MSEPPCGATSASPSRSSPAPARAIRRDIRCNVMQNSRHRKMADKAMAQPKLRIRCSVLSSDQKGVIAELEIARQEAEFGIGVWSPHTVERYDLIFEAARINWAASFEFAATLGRRG